MSDTENGDERRIRINLVPILFALALFSPLIYLLSLGPALWLLTPGSTIFEFYVLPAQWAYDSTGENAIWDLTEAYVEWWN